MLERNTKLHVARRSHMSSPKKTTHGVRFMEKTLNPLLHEMKLREQRFSTLDFVIGAGFALIAAAAVVMIVLIWVLQPAF